jgi:hypothetical protein
MIIRSVTPIRPARAIALSDGVLATREGPYKVIRENYRVSHARIATTHDLRATLRAGRFTSVGGYPLFFYTSDGAALCFECAAREYRQLSEALRTNANDGWRVVGVEINYEDATLTCDHCSKPIESAYAVDDTAPTEPEG